MRAITSKSSTPTSIFFISLFVFFVALASFIATNVDATPSLAYGEKLITVHDNGKKRGLFTRASTLRQAFEEAKIAIDPNDMIEPGLDEPLIATNYEVNVYRARPVTIVDGSVRERIMSPYQTPSQIMEQAQMTLQPEDVATVDVNSDIVAQGTGVQLTIDRATPFTLVLYGTKTTAYTQATTVDAMLKDKKITIAADDTLSVSKGAAIQAGMTVELWRNGKQTATEEQDVAFETEKIQDADREVGFKQVKTPGERGKKTVTYEIDMKNGQEVSRKEIQSVVTKEPKKQVEIVGTKLANSFSGGFAEALARLRSCESGGNYANKKNPKYRGAYQYDFSTWANYQGIYDPADAPPAVQDEKAWLTYQRRGWQPWPSCSVKMGLQDMYR